VIKIKINLKTKTNWKNIAIVLMAIIIVCLVVYLVIYPEIINYLQRTYSNTILKNIVAAIMARDGGIRIDVGDDVFLICDIER